MDCSPAWSVRFGYDPLAETYTTRYASTSEPRWLDVRSMSGTLLDSHPLPRGVDITKEFVQAILNHLSDGWTVPEFSSRSVMFRAVRGRETRLVYVVLNEPGKEPTYRSGAQLVRSPGRED